MTGKPRIEDYFLIGDLHTSALVSKRASIDWMCWPRFDSSSIFARLLDEKAGCFNLVANDMEISAKYSDKSAIARFECKTDQGAFILEDYMLPQPIKDCERHALLRTFHSVTKNQKISLVYNPVLDYGLEDPEIITTKDGLAFTNDQGHKIVVVLPDSAEVNKTEIGYAIDIDLAPGQMTTIKLEYIKDAGSNPISIDTAYAYTVNFWHEWISQGRFYDFCKSRMIRSAITLKLLQYYPSGALVAAPTTSLPECIGGERNWDYRYTWIRDSTFTIYAFFILGYKKEAEKFFEFVESVISRDKGQDRDLELMYTIKGERIPDETELKQLEGYKNSRPVRVGNGAADQFQLDTYGIMLDTYYFMIKHGGFDAEPYRENIEFLADKIISRWQEPDNGIWEVRDKRQHYIYSKVICWVGLNRVNRLQNKIELPDKKRKRYEETEQEIHEWLWQNGYKEEINSFSQHPNTLKQDASTLLFAPLQFLDRHKVGTKQIIDETYKELRHDEVFISRYDIDDGLKGSEGAFLLCSFWLIASLAMCGRGRHAYEIFSKIEGTMNSQYLLPEEYDPDAKQYLGNYPQSFSHMGYIFSAYYLKRYAPNVVSGEED